jgi:hypothetical protein
MTLKNRDELQRVLIENSILEPNTGCRLWKRGVCGKTGYGEVWNGEKTVSTHRLSFELFKEKIPIGIFVCHRCDVRSCINPDHLFLGTAKDNMKDASLKGRMPRGDKNGARLHPEKLARGNKNGARLYPDRLIPPKGERNGMAKLSSEDVQEIKIKYLPGKISYRELAESYGVSRSAISKIIIGKSWRHL